MAWAGEGRGGGGAAPSKSVHPGEKVPPQSRVIREQCSWRQLEPAEVIAGPSGSIIGLVWGTRERSQQLKARTLSSCLRSSSCKALATSGRQAGGRR